MGELEKHSKKRDVYVFVFFLCMLLNYKKKEKRKNIVKVNVSFFYGCFFMIKL